MATTPSTNINIPYSPFIDPTTGRPAQEWLLWLMNPNVISFNIATALPVTSGGTGLSTIPTNGQLLIGNGTGYTLNPLTPGSGITIGNGAGTISVTNSGVLSILAGSGISASTPAGNVTVTNTGVLSFAGGSTGLTPAAATVGAVSLAGTLVAGYGGTGLNTYAVGDIIYASGATALSRLADVATGNALISGGVTTAPSWGKIGLTTHVSGTLPIGNGGTNGTATPTAGAIAYGTGSAIAYTAAGTTGQVLTSATAGTPTWTTPTTGTVTAVSVVSANGLAGSSSGGATPALTLSTTITGLLKGNGTAISAATSGTDYAPATSGTSILYGNGSGGFSNVTIGTGVSFAAGTLSATGSGGTVTSVTGTSPVVSSGGTTPAISMPAATTSVNGYLTSTDWTTFNNKGSGTVTSVSGTAGRITSTGGTTPVIDLVSGIATPGTTGSVSLIPVVTIDTYGRVTSITTAANPQGTVTSVAALTLGTTGTDLSSTVATGTTTPVITLQVPTASASNRGALSAADWTTFNSKGSGSVTSVSGTGTVNGLSLSGTVTTTGSLTLSGTLSGTASGLTAGNVTTNANLTGPITSVGNATSIASQTGTGTKFVVDTSPTLVTPNIGVATATSLNFGGTSLANYVESSWTPTDASGAGLTLTINSAVYTRIGRAVFVECRVVWPANASAAQANIGGLPFTPGAQDYPFTVWSNSGAGAAAAVTGSSAAITLFTANFAAALANSALAGLTLRITGFYFV